MPKGDQRPALDFLQPVLHVRCDRKRHHQRSGDFEERRSLDRLYVSPEMTVAMSEITEPPTTGKRFDGHRQKRAVRRDVRRPISSRSASNVASSEARTWISCVIFSVRFSSVGAATVMSVLLRWTWAA